MYVGGDFDSATAVPLYENDPVSNDGFYVGSVYLNTGQSGYFIYLNSPESSTDYSGKENLTGQSCAYSELMIGIYHQLMEILFWNTVLEVVKKTEHAQVQETVMVMDLLVKMRAITAGTYYVDG